MEFPVQLTPNVNVRWRTPRSAANLEALVNRLRGPEDEPPPPGGGYTLMIGPALPDAPETDRIFHLGVDVPTDERELRWELSSSPRPAAPPPDELAPFISRFGGAPGVLEVIAAAQAQSGPPSVAQYLVTVELPESEYECKVIPLSPPPLPLLPVEMVDFADQIRLEHVGYRLDAGAMGIEEITITYHHEPRRFHLVIRARSGLEAVSPEGRWVPFADRVLDAVIPRFFTTKPEVAP